MTLSQLRTQVDALCRKYATQLEVYRLRPLAQEFCDEMTDAVIGPEPGPKLSLLDWIQILIKLGGRIRHPASAIRHPPSAPSPSLPAPITCKIASIAASSPRQTMSCGVCCPKLPSAASSPAPSSPSPPET